MSWSVGTTGTKDEVKKRFVEQMDVYVKMYNGKEEGKDVTLVKERGLALLEAQTVPAGKLVSLTAFGSHSVWDGNISNASFKFELGFIDAPPQAA